MAKKFNSFLLALALVAASTGAFAAAWEDDDLPQRQEAMADAVRVMASYDPALHAEAVHGATRVVDRELLLLRPIFRAVSKMPEGSAADVRSKEEARAAAIELLTGHLGQLLPGGSVKHVGGAATAASSDEDGENLQQRQNAMKEAVKVFSDYNPTSTDPQALKRAVATVNGAMTPLRPIFKAISRMPESTAAEVRAKEEARAAANELLTRHLGQLLPGGSAKIVDEFSVWHAK